MLRTWAVIAIVAGCSSHEAGPAKRSEPRGAAPPADPRPPDCDRRMDRLAQRLRALAPHAATPSPAADRRIPADRGRPIAGDDYWFFSVAADGAPEAPGLGGRDHPRARIAEYVAGVRRGRDRPALDAPCYLTSAPTTTAAALATAIDHLRAAGLTGEARVMVSLPPPDDSDPALLASPGVAALRTQLAGDPSARAAALAEALQSAIAPCAAVMRLFGATALAADKNAVLLEVPEAVRSCRCQMADLDVLEFSMLSLFRAYQPRVGWRPLPAPAGDDTRTMAEVVAALPP